jgi:NAD(P)-dependent dehydrogenase (short-subunit alcohol dehydrogenase family)
MDNFSLTDKNIIITGASSGIGRQCAISCSKMGANIILVSRNKERLNETLSFLEGNNHLVFAIDVTDYNKIEPIINDAVTQLGKINGFIHSAGIEMTLPLNLLNSSKLEDIYSINVIAAFNIARILSKKIYIGENASFVMISSVMAQYGQSGKIGYCSSKGALISGAKAMAIELARKQIRVNSILPGIVRSEMSEKLLSTLSEEGVHEIEKMHPLGIGSVSDVANACIYLLSDASTWVTGTNLIVDGGYSAK